MSRSPALLFAVLAILVHAPRLGQAFLIADGIAVPEHWRLAVDGLTGLATAAVLSGGGAYLAHELARGGRYQRILLGCWVLENLFLVVLIAPLLVLQLRRSELALILAQPALHWLSAVVAVLAVEVLAAASMLAQARQPPAEPEAVLDSGQLDADFPTTDGADSSTDSSPEPTACRNGCGWMGRSTMAEAGHQRWCTRRRPAHQSPEGRQALPPASVPAFSVLNEGGT